MIKRILKFMLAIFAFIMINMPVSAIAVIMFYYIFSILINPLQDTITITNFGFVTIAALSNVCFGFARSSEVGDEINSTLIYCGERFLHGAIQLLMASVIKYFVTHEKIVFTYLDARVSVVLTYAAGYFIAFLFMGMAINVVASLRELNTVLWNQKKKRPGFELLKLF